MPPAGGNYVILSEFCENFAFYGIKAVLVLFIFNELDFDKDQSSILFHIFLMTVGTFAVVSDYLADKICGHFRMIMCFSILYALGCIILALTAIIDKGYLMITSLLSLVMFAIGAGGIKNCLRAFSINQFKLPKYHKRYDRFVWRENYFVFVAALLSTAITPALRDDFHYYSDYGCFPLVFALSAVLIVVAVIVLIAGLKKFIIKPATNDIYSHIGDDLENTKSFYKILLLYLPLSFFWSLFEQKGSRWTLQATRMDGELWGYNIKPDQMQLTYYLLSLILVPLIYYIIYPILSLLVIRTRLKKFFLGGLLAAAAFFLAASLEVDLEKLDPLMPNKTAAQLRAYNGMHCNYSLSQILHSNSTETVKVEPLGYYEAKDLQKCNVSFHALDNINANSSEFSCTKEDVVKAIDLGKAVSFFIRQDFIQLYEAHVDKPKLGTPIVRPLINVPQTAGNFTLKDSADLRNSLAPYSTKAILVTRGEVSLLSNNSILTTFDARSGCVYVLLAHRNKDDNNKYDFRTYQTVEPNTIHMMWQLPQYICITAGEIMFNQNALEFSIFKAPADIQPALKVSWWLTRALGNFFAVIIIKLKIFETQSNEYRLFAVIMLIDMLILMALYFKSDLKPEYVPETYRRRKRRTTKSSRSQSKDSNSRPTNQSSQTNESDLQNSLSDPLPEESATEKPFENSATPLPATNVTTPTTRQGRPPMRVTFLVDSRDGSSSSTSPTSVPLQPTKPSTPNEPPSSE